MSANRFYSLWEAVLKVYNRWGGDKNARLGKSIWNDVRGDIKAPITIPELTDITLSLYAAIIGKSKGKREYLKPSEIGNLWCAIIGRPRDYAEFQSQLLSLTVSAYSYTYTTSLNETVKYFSINEESIIEALKTFYHLWEKSGFLNDSIPRIIFQYILEGHLVKFNIKSSKEIYRWLGKLHDLLEGMGCVSLTPMSGHIMKHIQNPQKDLSKQEPGRAFELIPTAIGVCTAYYIIKHVEVKGEYINYPAIYKELGKISYEYHKIVNKIVSDRFQDILVSKEGGGIPHQNLFSKIREDIEKELKKSKIFSPLTNLPSYRSLLDSAIRRDTIRSVYNMFMTYHKQLNLKALILHGVLKGV